MRTPALDSIVVAGALDRFEPIRQRISQFHNYLGKVFHQSPKLSVSVNKALKFKVDRRDLELTKDLTGEFQFPAAVDFVHDRMSSSQYACVNWWNQTLLVLTIVAADQRNQSGEEVSAEHQEKIDTSIELVVKAYDKLIGKLKSMWERKSIWHKIGRKISEAWARLKRTLLKISRMLLDKISLAQSWVSRSDDNLKKATKYSTMAISLSVSILMSLFANVEHSIMSLFNLVISSGAASNTSSKMYKGINALIRATVSDKGKLIAKRLKTYTKPSFFLVDRPSVSTDNPIKSTLDSIADQIKHTSFYKNELKKFFESVLETNAEKNHGTLNHLTRDELRDYGVEISRKSIAYRSPFSGNLYTFRGSERKIAQKLEHDFTVSLVKLGKGVAPEDLLKHA